MMIRMVTNAEIFYKTWNYLIIYWHFRLVTLNKDVLPQRFFYRPVLLVLEMLGRILAETYLESRIYDGAFLLK